MPSTTVAKKHKCQECNKTYKLLRMLKLHVSKCHSKDAKVVATDDGKQNDGQFKSKSKKTETTSPPDDHKCPRCDLKFSTERLLFKHQRSQHGGYPCSHCDKLYKSRRNMLSHSLITHAEAPLIRSFICDFEGCNKGFFTKTILREHKRTVHFRERNFVCELCGWHAKHSGALKVHMRSHTGEKPFSCKECGKSFYSSSLLIEHKPIHSAERPHKCDVCGAAFSRPKSLYHHKFLHSDVKRFVCKICSKAYAQAAGLAGHMRQHRAQQEGIVACDI